MIFTGGLMENREILKMEKVTYYYTSRTERIEILEDAGFAFETGKLYAVMGPSGSGKTTTLMLLGGLDTPKEGEILFQNRPIREIGLQKFRALHSGIVFQSYNLFPYLSACENVEIPMEISGKTANKKERAKELLEKVGLGSRRRAAEGGHCQGAGGGYGYSAGRRTDRKPGREECGAGSGDLSADRPGNGEMCDCGDALGGIRKESRRDASFER